jgi:hypothetical protein
MFKGKNTSSAVLKPLLKIDIFAGQRSKANPLRKEWKMLEEIRKTGLYFTWMVLTAGQIGSQTDAAGPQRLSSEAFETAFRQVMDASDDCFRSLAGSGSLRIFGSEYQQITLRFPGEVLAGYTCKVYHEAYGTTTVNDIHVLYHDGSNSMP